ncbi:50S ribosomal protein L25 [Verrucomicrobia bacterium LW23]|nr:50S ribosomal protein L25 [Verrucomicrobia bacterium LW23]
MAKILPIKVTSRAQLGRAGAKSTRSAGNIPGILYGKKTQPTPIQINSKELTAVLHGASSENVLLDLAYTHEGNTTSRLALLQDVQHHVLKDYIVHVDLHEIAQDEVLHTEVPIQEVGESIGVKSNGGLLEKTLRSLRVECLPRDLPEVITVDISALDLDQSIHVSDLKLPAGVTALNSADATVLAVLAPAKEEEAADEGDVKQPEVIKEKKVDPAAADAKGGKAAAKPAGKK